MLFLLNGKIILEPLPDDPYSILDKIIKEPYKEEIDEKKAEEMLLKNACR